MQSLGIDLGSSSVKLVLLENGSVTAKWLSVHHGRPFDALRRGLTALPLSESTEFSLAVTGSSAEALRDNVFVPGIDEIPAIVEGARFLCPDVGSVIEIGSQGARFITDLHGKTPQFAVNEHCAGGTGSFFEDQMSRVGCRLEDYSRLVAEAKSIPRLSGRCAVFAKTDIIHRQQEGSTTPDILLGLCYAMIRNYKASIVRQLPVHTPLLFCGGVTMNAGVIRAIRDVFGLREAELVVPALARFAAAGGAALKAEGRFTLVQLLNIIQRAERELGLRAPVGCLSGERVRGFAQGKALFIQQAEPRRSDLPRLRLPAGICLQNPKAAWTDAATSSHSGSFSAGTPALGIDIGSTSTDLVLIDAAGQLLDFQYLRTAGDPEAAVRKGLDSIYQRFGKLRFSAVGVTGSGRERIGKRIGADAVRDEITAQARGAVFWVPEADTVFEIGGQDSKYISLQNGEVVDFQMNKICAAGTGSFVEEQAIRMGIPLAEFGALALSAESPAVLGERCTVFIETAIASAAAEGVSQADIAAGLCHSIVRNYLHKVVGTHPVGQHIVLQGGVAYNPGIVAAFRAVFGDRLQVNPCFPISGAFGAALLAQEAVGWGESRFTGFDGSALKQSTTQEQEIRQNTAFYQQANKLLLAGYTGKRDPHKKTVGVPFCLMIHKFFPMANAFFSALGYNVLLTDPTSEETIRLSQLTARGETCYPVKLIYGHMQQLIDQKVDYIFMPSIHTMRHETSRVKHNYGCVYMQTAAASVARALQIEEKGITLLNPVFDLDFGKEAMAAAMLGLGKILGIPKPLCAAALLKGSMAVRQHTAAVEKQGAEMLASLKKDDKVLVLITRNYGVSDPVLNMGIPELLLARGHKVLTLSHLPGHALDISPEYDNLYYPFGQHILSGAKLIAHHPNLYAVYLTNHGCGPDTMLSQLFRREMGDKPYLQIEVDEHFSNVGVITRIEAFLNSLSHRPTVKLPEAFRITDVEIRSCPLPRQARPDMPLYLPSLGAYTPFLLSYFRQQGMDARVLPFSDAALQRGRAETSAKEYLPFPALLGAVLEERTKDTAPAQFLIPQSEGAEADGLYARVIQAVLERRGVQQATIVAPMLERLPETAADPDALLRAFLAGDLVYAAPIEMRGALTVEMQRLLDWPALEAVAREISAAADNADTVSSAHAANSTHATHARRLACVGTPLCLTELNSGVLSALEAEGNQLLRAPLSELLLFLWLDNAEGAAETVGRLRDASERLQRIGTALCRRSAFSADFTALFRTADQALPRFAGANGRYRYAKAVELSKRAAAVLTLAPRYENTAMILDMRGLREVCQAPLFQLSLDNDWDEAAWSRLRSFLYYC